MEPLSEPTQDAENRLGLRLWGLTIAVLASLALIVVYLASSPWLRIPALVAGELALPAVGVTLGLFQAATGIPLWELEDRFSEMSLGKRFATLLTLMVLLGIVLVTFMRFAGPLS